VIFVVDFDFFLVITFLWLFDMALLTVSVGTWFVMWLFSILRCCWLVCVLSACCFPYWRRLVRDMLVLRDFLLYFCIEYMPARLMFWSISASGITHGLLEITLFQFHHSWRSCDWAYAVFVATIGCFVICLCFPSFRIVCYYSWQTLQTYAKTYVQKTGLICL